MKKYLVFSEAVLEAVTTTAATNEPPYHNGDYKNLAQQGDALLREKVLSFLKEKGITNPGKVTAIVSESIANKNLANIFEKIARAYNIRVRMGGQERSQGLSEKTKAGIMEAILFATYDDDQEEVFHEIFAEITKTISFNTSPTGQSANPVNEVQEIMQRSQNGTIADYLTEERAGGPDHAPIWELTLNYDGISVSEQGANKKEVKKLVCQKWLDESGAEEA